MLVISRKPKETVCFPALGITLQIVRVQNQLVRVGIEAPADVKILRGELADRPPVPHHAPDLSHALRNRLNNVTLALHLLQQQLELKHSAAASATLKRALAHLEKMNEDAGTVKLPSRLRTLIVEDERNERELLAGLLDMHGCDCATAADGTEALAYLQKNVHPDFVLLDMRMPHCDGPQTLRQIRDDPDLSGLKVFGISGSTPEESGLNIGPAGVDAWFRKPINPRQLWDAIRKNLPPAN
jgi:carbon storage regulator CsrA